MNGTEVAQQVATNGPPIWQIIQTGVLAITCIVVGVYTLFTYQLRNETKKQTDHFIKPFIVIKYDSFNAKYKFTNKGLGVALNINFERTHFYQNCYVESKIPIEALSKDEGEVIPFKYIVDEKPASDPHGIIFKTEEKLEINVYYQDIFLENYYTSVEIIKNKVITKSYGKFKYKNMKLDHSKT